MTPSNNVAHTSPGNVDFYVYDNACNKIGIYLNAGHDSKDMAAIDSTLKWTVEISKYTAPNYWGQGAELQLKYSTQTVKMSKGGCDCTAQVTDQGTWQSCSCAFKCP